MFQQPRNRAVISGIGIFAANGNSKDAFWNSLVNGRSGIGPITLFDASDLHCRIAGEVKDFDPHDYIDSGLKPKRRMARATQLAVAATEQALQDAGLTPADLQAIPAFPIFMGVSTTAMDLRERPARPWTTGSSVPNAVASTVAAMLRLDARLVTLSNACVSGLDAVAAAAREIRQGRCDMVLCGGSDAALAPYVFKAFQSSRKMSLRNDNPQQASRPFDRERDGGVAAEASGMLILETLSHALARGVRPYAEIVGYGSCADRRDSLEAAGLENSMREALANAAMRAERLGYINAHAPSDMHLDRMEVAMLKKVLGQHAYRVPVMSIKGHTGNPLAAGGVLQIIATALALHRGTIPPTANLVHPDPQCDLDHVMGQPRALAVETALVNSHGLGRANSSLIMRQAPC